MQVVLLQCRIKCKTAPDKDICQQVDALLSDHELIRANSLKMVYTVLREHQHPDVSLQSKILKRFTEKQLTKLGELSDTDTINTEVFEELMCALKELTELTTSLSDKLAFLQQAACLSERALMPNFMKWVLSYGWNCGVQAYQRDSDRDLAKRYFQLSMQTLQQCSTI